MGINTHGKMVFILKWGPDALPLESIPQPYIQKKKKLLSQWTDWYLSIYINKTILITEKKIFDTTRVFKHDADMHFNYMDGHYSIHCLIKKPVHLVWFTTETILKRQVNENLLFVQSYNIILSPFSLNVHTSLQTSKPLNGPLLLTWINSNPSMNK